MDINKSIKKFNQRKTESEKKFLYAFGFIALSIIIVIILVNQSTSENLMIIPLLTAIPGLVFVIMGAVGFSKVKKSFKNDFLSAIFDELIPGIIYKPERGLSKTIVYETEFLKRADRFHTEDYLEGKIDDIDFVSSDVKLEERRVRHTKNGTQTYYVPYFVGRVFRFDFHKELVGHLQVLENGRPVSKRRFKKIQLESIDFNKKFKVYSEEDLTAFYILTP
ncbi:MAG TPA: DUF3137 domain-containing protein, partial [Candidatus Izemoplasmatales bacterium]|nr:DUF3137 domain-containing protein [Candidatus Izemoplasmatales bacterium]